MAVLMDEYNASKMNMIFYSVVYRAPISTEHLNGLSGGIYMAVCVCVVVKMLMDMSNLLNQKIYESV